MAPESFLDGVTTVRSDIFMFGVLLWGMISVHTHLIDSSVAVSLEP